MDIPADDILLAAVSLDTLARDDLAAMAEAGRQIQDCYRVLRKSDANVVAEVLKDQGEFFEWDHYPKGDVYDWDSHSQYYYHAHPAENRRRYFADEHGHFHTFLRAKGMPAGMVPAPVADFRPLDDENDMLTHFVAIAMDSTGEAIGLFTTNRWVTGETWYVAEDVIAMLEKFEVDQARPSWPTNVWITNMLRLFRPDIERLLGKRDRTVAAWQAAHPGTNAYEDRNLELTSIAAISVEDRICAVERALAA